MGQKSSSAWVWLVAGGVALYAAFSHHDPPPPTATPAPTAHAVVAPQPTAPAPPAPALVLQIAKRLLLLTHTGQFKSRDLHARALAALQLIPVNAPEYAEATQLRRGILSAYTSKGGTPPTADGSALAPEMLQALRDPIVAPAGATAPSSVGSQQYAENLAPTDDANPAPAPGPVPTQLASQGLCAENGSCYGDVSAATGQPKSVFVHSYTRKDGTPVRSHYRSK